MKKEQEVCKKPASRLERAVYILPADSLRELANHGVYRGGEKRSGSAYFLSPLADTLMSPNLVLFLNWIQLCFEIFPIHKDLWFVPCMNNGKFKNGFRLKEGLFTEGLVVINEER